MQNYIAKNLKVLRKSEKMTQHDLAVILELNRGNITSYERDVATPSLEVIVNICDYFKISLNDFISKDLALVDSAANGIKNDVAKLKEKPIVVVATTASEEKTRLSDTKKVLNNQTAHVQSQLLQELQAVTGSLRHLLSKLEVVVHHYLEEK